jgi:CheY-like chemotaxis protein
MRILVVSPDRQFRTVMSLLLARRNCSVTTSANASRVVELIDRESADVVVLDASEPSAAPTVATVEALARPVGVVLVGEELGLEADGLPLLTKWGPFGELVAAIKRADESRATVGGTRERR